jgi:hypothetical protein
MADKSSNIEYSVALQGQRDHFAMHAARYVRATITSVPNES